MLLKDYYDILDINSSAGQQEIKKAYRRLAQQYHPDKNPADPYAAARFAEAKEAYEVLMHPGKKERYLQQRWYEQSMGNKKTRPPVTPVNILKQVLELDRHISRLDVHRMDKEGLTSYMLDIIPDASIHQLKTFNEPGVCKQIIMLLIKECAFLTPQQAQKISVQLYKLSDDDQTKLYITAALQQYRKKRQLERYQPYLIIMASLVIAVLIWLLSR